MRNSLCWDRGNDYLMLQHIDLTVKKKVYPYEYSYTSDGFCNGTKEERDYHEEIINICVTYTRQNLPKNAYLFKNGQKFTQILCKLPSCTRIIIIKCFRQLKKGIPKGPPLVLYTPKETLA